MITIDECPTSYVSPESLTAVQQFHQRRHLSDLGVTVDLESLAACDADVLSTLRVEELRIEHERLEQAKTKTG